ncbi:carbohydrate ABC transporter permease [Oscillospiraceae bacterium PP1C4]
MKNKKRRLILLEILLIIISVIALYPIFLVVINSLKSFKEVMTNVIALPTKLMFENYAVVWERINYPRLFFNNLVITSVAIFGIITLSSIAGFMLSRTKTKLSWFLYMFFITPMLIPFQTIMIPLLKFTNMIHLSESIVGLGIQYWGFAAPTAIFMYHSFSKSIPKELDESAIIDGASTPQMFYRIIFPLLKPVTSTIIIIDVMWIWNDFLLPLIMINGSEKTKTLTLAAYSFVGQYVSDWQYTMAAIVLSVLPSIIFFIVMQKNIVKGVTAGAIKG